MIEWLALMLTVAVPAPTTPPPGCQVTASRGGLLVTVGRAEATLAFDDREAALIVGDQLVRPTLLAAPSGALYAAMPEDWQSVHQPVGLGRLYAVTCGRDPAIARAVEIPGVDFGHARTLPDGRWVVGGWGGLRIFDADTKRLVPLTGPSPLAAPCWSATEGRTAPVADVPEGRGEALASGAEVPFLRGGACGYEGAMEMQPHALDLGRGVVRRRVAIGALALDGDRVFVTEADMGCRKESAGVMWTSDDGARFTLERVVNDSAATGIERLVRLPDGPWLARTAICRGRGGEVFMSADRRQWKRVFGLADDQKTGEDLGVVELFVDGDRAFAATNQKQGSLTWWVSRDGATWAPAGRRVSPPALSQALAATLGVAAITGLAEAPSASWAATSDGLFRKPKEGGPWARVFLR